MRIPGAAPRAAVFTAFMTASIVLASPSTADAQRRGGRGDGTLDRVAELTRLGRADEARAELTQWWESAASASRADMQRALWLRGRLTVDPAQAELDFQRLIVLYPSGDYTAQALLRLAQAAHGRGDAESARSHVEALARDHPNDPVRREAEAWLRGAGPVEPAEARTDVRAEEAVRRGRDERAGGEASRGGGRRGSPEERGRSRSEPEPDAEAHFSVQLGAFADADRALALLEDVRAAGVDARLVRVVGSRFLHVRVGRFRERDDAAARLEALQRLGFTAAIVRDERAEQVVRAAGGS